MEILEIAINFLRVNVERGDTLEDIMASQVGGGCKEYHCTVNHNTFIDGKRVPRDTILVERAGEQIVNKVFKLQEIIDIINQREVQQTLF